MEANLSHKLPLKGAQEVAECSNAWLLYLQSLASVCAAGARVSASLQVLANGAQVTGATGNCRAAWEELSRASQAAGHSVRTEVLSGLRELGSEDQLRNDQIIQSSLATLINFQYQFCVACVECFGNISPQEQCHQVVTPSNDLSRQSQLFSRILSGQRRWSEVARRPPAEREEDCEEGGIGRRWSVPWESSSVVSGHHHLTVPGQERSSRSTTPDTSSSLASQEELHDVISLLSLKPANHLQQNPRHLPGVTFTSCGPGDVKDGWPGGTFSREAPSVNWSQSSLSESIEGTPQNLCQIRVNTSPRQSHLQRPRTGWTPQDSLYSTIWGEQDGDNPNRPVERTEPFVQSETNGGLYHRKSSSSTDSSSSSSIPQHQLHHQMTLQGTSPLYSMWSGNDMPLIQLPSGSSAGQSSSLDTSLQPPNARSD